MPDELLAEVDAEAARAGTTRSALLRHFVIRALKQRREKRVEAMATLLGAAAPHGGDSADRVKDTRP